MISDLTKEQHVEAFDHIKNILFGRTFGSSKKTNLDAYRGELYIDYEEFKNIQFIGYSSDDVDAFLNIIMNSEYSCPPVEKIILFNFPQFHIDTKIGDNIYALAEDSAELRYMVGGMTNYSGTGGASYRKFKLVIEFLSELHDISLEIRNMDKGTDEILLNRLNEKVCRE